MSAPIGGAGGGGMGLVGSVPISLNLAAASEARSGIYGPVNVEQVSGGGKWSWVVSLAMVLVLPFAVLIFLRKRQ